MNSASKVALTSWEEIKAKRNTKLPAKKVENKQSPAKDVEMRQEAGPPVASVTTFQPQSNLSQFHLAAAANQPNHHQQQSMFNHHQCAAGSWPGQMMAALQGQGAMNTQAMMNALPYWQSQHWTQNNIPAPGFQGFQGFHSTEQQTAPLLQPHYQQQQQNNYIPLAPPVVTATTTGGGDGSPTLSFGGGDGSPTLSFLSQLSWAPNGLSDEVRAKSEHLSLC